MLPNLVLEDPQTVHLFTPSQNPPHMNQTLKHLRVQSTWYGCVGRWEGGKMWTGWGSHGLG